MQYTWKSGLFLALTTLLLALTFTPTTTFTNAQSPQCHACIVQTIPRVTNCTTLPQTSHITLIKLIHGDELFNVTSDFRNGDPPAFDCLVSLMWNVVHYKDTLWSSCLQPDKACVWAEMMQYLQIVTKVASIYGMRTPPVSDFFLFVVCCWRLRLG
ncbi:hypothetical protein K457DRAFT_138203 [Linnemannia elongata AG-77]|uniref:Uncharacterized protein n=1 Tax=Linnemannia elongata AG-77 TaxID=1314771 RepID=A0A197JXJ8_9FUNG|nr:hypothetical protein K457DRAFT_138203 [Linnemannia elongata AG-77]